MILFVFNHVAIIVVVLRCWIMLAWM